MDEDLQRLIRKIDSSEDAESVSTKHLVKLLQVNILVVVAHEAWNLFAALSSMFIWDGITFVQELDKAMEGDMLRIFTDKVLCLADLECVAMVLLISIVYHCYWQES